MENPVSGNVTRPTDDLAPPVKEVRPIEVYSRFGDVERFLETYLLQRAPFALPESFRQFLVRIAPWIVLISLIFSIPLIFMMLGLGAIILPLTVFSHSPMQSVVSMTIVGIVTLGSVVFYGLALRGLFRRTKSAWAFVFYAILLCAIGNVVSLSLRGILFGTLLPLYMLFQTKYLYTEGSAPRVAVPQTPPAV